jgi:MraZ protein
MAFRGSFEHTLDDRGRIAIPAKYRSDFGNRPAVITPAPEGCLMVFPEPAFEEMTKNDMANVPATSLQGRRLRRRFNPRAFDAELDRQGRILVPPGLRVHAGLEGPVLVVGNYEYLELWNPERWEVENEESDKASPDGQRSEE